LTKIVVRTGKETDASEILGVHRSSILGLGLNAYTQEECASWAAGLTLEGYVKAMTEGGESYLVALHGDQLVGFCSFKANEVIGLYVSPTISGCGVGTRLLGAAEVSMRSKGETRFKLTAALSALEFYMANDYRILSRKPWKTRGGREILVCDMLKEEL